MGQEIIYLKEIVNILYHIMAIISSNNKAEEKNPLKWLDNQEVMQMLHISESTLLRWRQNGTLKYVKVKGKIWYQEADIHTLLLQQCKR